LSQLSKHKERKRAMKSIKTTVAVALMLLLATGMIACKKSEEAAVVPPVEQTAPAMEPAAPMAPAPEAVAPEAAAPEAAAPEAAAPEAAPEAK
jgi:hypothetical protein